MYYCSQAMCHSSEAKVYTPKMKSLEIHWGRIQSSCGPKHVPEATHLFGLIVGGEVRSQNKLAKVLF